MPSSPSALPPSHAPLLRSAIVASGLALWVWTSADTLWRLRLDLFDPAFGQMQWQRFLIASKPALFLAGAAAVALPCAWAWTWWQRGRARALAGVPIAAAIALVAWAGVGQAAVMEKAAVGRPQIAVDPEDAELAADYDAMAEHLRSLWEADADHNWRMTVAAARNQHWYMDLPVRTGIPLYKQGFTPGDNFVHKPEAQHDHGAHARGHALGQVAAPRLVDHPLQRLPQPAVADHPPAHRHHRQDPPRREGEAEAERGADDHRGLAELARVADRRVLISTPWDPVWRAMNMLRGRYLADLGNTPGHIQHFTRRTLVELAQTELRVLERRTPLPWTILLGEPSR